MRILATILLFITLAVALLISMRASVVSAQATATRTPTDDPVKPPYVFPTPIFIPTYPGDTPVPGARTTPIIQVTGATTYTVVSGDSPWIIAQKVYGDGSKYQLILDANNMTKETRLRVGSILQIPPLPGSVPVSTPTATIALVQSTSAAPTLAPAQFLTTTPFRPLTPGATTTLTPNVPGMLTTQLVDAAPTILNILAGIFFVSALGTGALAFLLFNRSRRMEDMNTRKKRLTLRQ